jgi:NAD(P)-dependent dehydrogenase (short-subunit alcohol dehydrogenase family)
VSSTGRLAGKVCVITGAGSGIGRASALLFAREGACVVVADVDRAGADETVQQIRAEGGAANTVIADVVDPAAAQRLADDTVKAEGRIDVLFNNAGISGVGTAHETSVELWDRVMAVNVRGVFLVSKFVVPHMIQKKRGSIINMSSTIAEIGLAQRASYAASKGAILAFTRAMQVDYAPFGIRVNALLPGTIHTPFVEKYLRESYPNREEGLAAIRKRQLTSELGRPEDVASAALFLASDESSFVMGTGLFVDGGVRGGK